MTAPQRPLRPARAAALTGALSLGCAQPPDASLLAQALDPARAGDDAVEACEAIAADATRDECLASVVRAHPDLTPDAADAACSDIAEPRWRGECFFSLAERRVAGAAPTPEGRLPALRACGQAGPFYDECLYHLWTAELSALAEAAPSAPAAVEPARPVVAWWAGLQTIAGDPAEQLWGDLWYFAWNEHRPADLAACAALPPGDATRCRAHTETFVLRAILGELMAPGAPTGLLDRTCRSGEIPAALTAGLYAAHPALDAQVARAAELSCEAASGRPVRRYNPVFQARGGQP